MKLEKIVDKIMQVLLGTCMFGLVLGAIWQVISRFILKNPSIFTEEFLRYLLIWSGMIGTTYGFFKNAHLSLVLLKAKVKGKAATAIYIFNELVIVSFVAPVLIYGGAKLVLKNTEQISAILRLPMSLVYSIIPICGGLILILKALSYLTAYTNYKISKGAN